MNFSDNIRIESIEGCVGSNELRIIGVTTPSITLDMGTGTDYTAPFSFLLENNEKNKRKNKLPKRYIINKGATILFWDKDGNEKTIVKRSKDDKFNKRLGFLTAYFQYHSGLSKTKANKYLDGLEIEKD